MGASLRGHSRLVALVVATAVLIATASAATAAPALAGTGGDRCRAQNEDVIADADVSVAERSLLCLINVHRAAAGVPVLTGDSRLTIAARGHSEDMVASGRYDFEGSDGSMPGGRAKAAGYPGDVAETLYALPRSGGVSPVQFFLGWKNDERNDGVLLDPRYAATGIGFVLGTPFREGDGSPTAGATVTQDLGTEPADGSYTGLDMLIPAECPPAKKAVQKAKRKLRKALETGTGVAKAKRRLAQRKAAARRACDPSRF